MCVLIVSFLLSTHQLRLSGQGHFAIRLFIYYIVYHDAIYIYIYNNAYTMTNILNIIDNSPFFYFLPLFASFFLLDRAGQAIFHVISRSSIIIKEDLILDANFASIVWHFCDKNEAGSWYKILFLRVFSSSFHRACNSRFFFFLFLERDVFHQISKLTWLESERNYDHTRIFLVKSMSE